MKRTIHASLMKVFCRDERFWIRDPRWMQEQKLKPKLTTRKSLKEWVVMEQTARKAHARTIHNETEILEHSHLCGCCSCERIFESSEVTEQDILPELSGERTVWCPYCGIDAVFGDGCGIKPTYRLLKYMKRLYFGDW